MFEQCIYNLRRLCDQKDASLLTTQKLHNIITEKI